MTNWVVESSGAVAHQPITDTSTTKKHGLGTLVRARDIDNTATSGDFIYVKVSNSVTQYDAVAIKAGFTAAPLTLTNGQTAIEAGFAQIANGVKDTYMWVQKNGRPIIRLAAACEKDVKLYATATGGVLDDATTSCLIAGLYATTSATNTAVATGTTCVSRFPVVMRNPAT
jgi:urease accessory protein UreF